jgi:hypothetical protein
MDGLPLEDTALYADMIEIGQHTATAMAGRKWRDGLGRIAGPSARSVEHIVSSICQYSMW